jgi:hypothetical protein
MEPVNAFLEEGVPSCHGLVVAPVVGALQSLDDAAEVAEHHVSNDPFRQQLSQAYRQRLIMVVLPHEHHAIRAVARRNGGFVVLHPEKGRLLDDNMLACLERPQRQIEMKPGRHGDDDRIHARVFDGRRVLPVAAGTPITAAQLLGPRPVATGVTAGDVAPQRAQVPAVYARDESTSQKGDAQRCMGHRASHSTTAVRVGEAASRQWAAGGWQWAEGRRGWESVGG